MSETTAFSFSVTGRVQGVWFRGWTRTMATRLGLCGWVRNDPDGTVTGVIQGEPAALERMIAQLHSGPDLARIDSVTIAPQKPMAMTGFLVRR